MNVLPPLPIIFIEKIENANIIVIKNDDNIIIFDSTKKKQLYKEKSDKHRIILFSNVSKSKISVMCTTLGVFLLDCIDISLCISLNIIGSLSMLRCKNIASSIRNNIGFVEVDLCCKTIFYQRIESVLYILSSSIEGVVYKDDKYVLPSSMFSDRIFIEISKENKNVLKLN